MAGGTQSLSTICERPPPPNNPPCHQFQDTGACCYMYVNKQQLATPGIVKISVKLHHFRYMFNNFTGVACPQTLLAGFPACGTRLCPPGSDLHWPPPPPQCLH